MTVVIEYKDDARPIRSISAKSIFGPSWRIGARFASKPGIEIAVDFDGDKRKCTLSKSDANEFGELLQKMVGQLRVEEEGTDA